MAIGNGSESPQDASDEFATFEFPFSTMDWEDEIAFLESMPFSTIDSDDFTLAFGLTKCDVVRPKFCCESASGFLDYIVFVVKRLGCHL
jgi:hypothetical protein